MPEMDRCKLVLLLALGALVLACGSQAPPGTDASNYFPMTDGAKSVYQHSSKGGWLETIRLTESGPGTYREVDVGNPDGERTEAVLKVDSSGRVFRIGKEVYVDDVLDLSVTYEPGFIRFDPAWVDLNVNDSTRQGYERTETRAGGSPDPTRPRGHLYTSLGVQTVTVLGTRYRDCLVIHRQRDYDDASGDPEDEEKQFYFCPGVGKVQEINLDSGNTEQLVSYSE